VQLYRQALYDVASIRSEALELKEALLKVSQGDRPFLYAALAPYVQQAVQAHRAFLKRFEVEGRPPDKVDDECRQAYLSSRMALARAHAKLPSSASLCQALEQYQLVAAHIKAHPADGMHAEAQLCAEMTQLLPVRIAHLKREEAAAGQRGP